MSDGLDGLLAVPYWGGPRDGQFASVLVLAYGADTEYVEAVSEDQSGLYWLARSVNGAPLMRWVQTSEGDA